MLNTRIVWVTMVLLGSISVGRATRADEEKLALDKVPAAVMKGVKDKFPDAKVKEASKETEDGKTTYEVAIEDKGQAIDLALAADGTILEVEKTIAEKDLPKAVADAVKAKYPTATFKSAEWVAKGEKSSYEVVVSVGGKARELALDATGKILGDEAGD